METLKRPHNLHFNLTIFEKIMTLSWKIEKYVLKCCRIWIILVQNVFEIFLCMFIKLENNFFIKVIEENKVNCFDNDFIV
jgi:hypothetical protein